MNVSPSWHVFLILINASINYSLNGNKLRRYSFILFIVAKFPEDALIDFYIQISLMHWILCWVMEISDDSCKVLMPTPVSSHFYHCG